MKIITLDITYTLENGETVHASIDKDGWYQDGNVNEMLGECVQVTEEISKLLYDLDEQHIINLGTGD